jgi:glutamate-1-semialdehyde 2,1-aminomutase
MYPDDASKSASLYRRALECLPGGNSRTAVFRDPYPIYAVRGEGAHYWDADGNKLFDMVNNQSSLVHGHSHPKIVEAVRHQAGRLTSVCAPTELEIDLAEEICRRVPSIERVSFCNSGSEGVLFAIRAARAFTGRDAIAKVEGAYHGNLDAVEISVFPKPSVWGPDDAPAPLPEGLGIPAGALADTLVLPFNDVDAARRLIEENASRLACVVIDPAPPRMGFLEASDAFLGMLRETTTRHGILLIFDEVYAFRQSYSGAQGRRGIDADLTAMGKLIGGGLPIGATAGRADVLACFDPRGGAKAGHAGTFNANPLSMAAGKAALDMLTHQSFAHLDAIGERARSGLRAALSDAGLPGVVNGTGSLLSMIIGTDAPVRNVRDIARAVSTPGYGGRTPLALAQEYSRRMLNMGVIYAAPSLYILSTAMTESDIDEFLAKAREALRAIVRS